MDFKKLTIKEQRDILLEYVAYVTEYPETHDRGCYPVCFPEWYQHEWQIILEQARLDHLQGDEPEEREEVK